MDSPKSVFRNKKQELKYVLRKDGQDSYLQYVHNLSPLVNIGQNYDTPKGKVVLDNSVPLNTPCNLNWSGVCQKLDFSKDLMCNESTNIVTSTTSTPGKKEREKIGDRKMIKMEFGSFLHGSLQCVKG